MRRMVQASEEMRQGFGLTTMEPPDAVRAWFEDLFRLSDHAQAIRLPHPAPGSRRPVGRARRRLLWGDRRLVQVRGAQDEAAIHELAHAFWHDAREETTTPRR